MELQGIKRIEGVIKLQSGLHIGAGETEMRIGGTDNPVVTHPHTREPYIPGSSLKGKIRSLLELRSGLMGRTQGSPLGAGVFNEDLTDEQRKNATNILRLFGTSGADGEAAVEAGIGPTRGSFADCSLTERSKNIGPKIPLTEVKAENSINRISGTAENPRFTERVVAGLEFDFAISLKEMKDDPDLTDLLLQGMKMLEYDALGGNGSRGYGRVQIEFKDEDIQKRFDNTL